jgi:hypothetical protein
MPSIGVTTPQAVPANIEVVQPLPIDSQGMQVLQLAPGAVMTLVLGANPSRGRLRVSPQSSGAIEICGGSAVPVGSAYLLTGIQEYELDFYVGPLYASAPGGGTDILYVRWDTVVPPANGTVDNTESE